MTLVGCAFIKFEAKNQALAAIEALNGKHKMEVCASFAGFFLFICTFFVSPQTIITSSKNKMKQNKAYNLKFRMNG